MRRSPGVWIYENLANAVSLLGVLPICILFGEESFQYLVPLMIYNNIMDDLDGILAVKLNIKSNFGAILDNVCDAITHSIFVLVAGLHYGNVCAAFSLAAVVSIVLRVTNRLDSPSAIGTGSPTNELIRHTFFILLLARSFGFSPAPFLAATFAIHAVSMLVPFEMPYLIRSLTKSVFAISLVNLSLLVAYLVPSYLVPSITPIIAACFIVTYSYSFMTEGIRWLRRERR